MRIIYLAFISLLICSCGGGGSTASSGSQATPTGFDVVSVDGSNAEYNTKKNSIGGISEEGLSRNGVKDGSWLTYHPDNGGIKTLVSYSNGMKTGVSLEVSTRGQVDKSTGYLNDQLHGKQIEYVRGRVKKEVSYFKGVLDGKSIDYYDSGQIQKSIAYKDGKQHGKLEYFNEDGQLIMEYDYKNGEKVSGGIIEKMPAKAAEVQ